MPLLLFEKMSSHVTIGQRNNQSQNALDKIAKQQDYWLQSYLDRMGFTTFK